MSPKKRDFYGKEVTEAIRNACDELGVSQEQLDIEVVETGSTGIFGLIRKKAHIRVNIKPESEQESESLFEMESLLGGGNTDSDEEEPSSQQKQSGSPQAADDEIVDDDGDGDGDVDVDEEDDDGDEDNDDDDEDDDIPSAEGMETGENVRVSAESLELIRSELTQIVELMGFPSGIEVECNGTSVTCTLRGEHEENLTGPDGKVMDSLQYLLRKIISRKVPERIRLSVNVGDFREKRLEELKGRAVELAAQVKSDGKTQALPALNPSERREIHMVLQEDKDIRSRSVGDGLFKKILIYKPGKGNRGGRKRPHHKGKQARGGNKQERDS